MTRFYERDGYDQDREDREFSWGCFILSIIAIYFHCLYLRELEERNPDLYWIMLLAG